MGNSMKLNLKKSGSFIGIAGIAVMAFLFFQSGRYAPLWAVLLLNVIWFAHLVLGCRWFMTHPIRVFFLPVSLAIIWFGSVYLGKGLLDWA